MYHNHLEYVYARMPAGGRGRLTLPTAASPSSTSLTLLLGFGVSAMVEELDGGEAARFARRLLPTL